jgi:5-methyltetrahydrofolate--homocysteine methyltransferase
MQASVEILQPLLYKEKIKSAGKIVIGTVKGDLHDIGKNLVKMMLESAGFEVVDLGVDVTPEGFIKTIKETKADIVALSALLTTTMPMMQETINVITEQGLRSNVEVLVDGAPVTQTFAEEIGADGYAADAGSVNKLARRMIQ